MYVEELNMYLRCGDCSSGDLNISIEEMQGQKEVVVIRCLQCGLRLTIFLKEDK